MKKKFTSLFKTKFLLLFIFLVAVRLNTVAIETLSPQAEFSAPNATYTLADNDVVVENGVIVSCSYDFSTTDIIIPDTLDGQIVTKIARDVFASKGITSVDLSRCNSLVIIESNAFYHNAILTVQFAHSLQTIGQSAFAQNGLTSLDFSVCPELHLIDPMSFSENNIETANFSGCTALQQIGYSAFFYNKLTFLDLSDCAVLQEISAFAFKNNNLTSIQLPVSLRIIGDESFYLNQIESVNFSDLKALISIGTQAFDSNNLTLVDLSGHSVLQSIGNGAFSSNRITSVNFGGCTALESLSGFINNNLTSVNLSGLTALQSISHDAFGQNDIENVIFEGCTALQIIEDRAFRDNNLGLIDLSPCQSLKTIMYAVFENNQVGCGVILPVPDILGYKFNNWQASDGNEYEGNATFYNLAPTYRADLTEVFAVRFIISEGGNPISGAIVGFGSDITETTDNSGIASFINISDGTYTYTVSADGYETVSSSITVSGGDVSEDVEMTSTVDPNARILLAENSRFKIWGVAADAAAADTVLSVLTQNYDRIASTLNTQLGIITVDIYPSLDAYHDAMGWPDATDWMVGSASGESNIRMVSPYNPGPVANFNGILEVAVHEMVHCFVSNISNYSVPIWINEGTATYYSYQQPPNSGTIQICIDNLGHKPTLDELSSNNFGDIGGYQFSYTIAEFIIEHLGGVDMLVDFLASNENYSIIGYGSKQEFQTAWHNYIDEHYLGITNTYSVTLIVTDGQNPIVGAEVIFSGYEDQPVFTDNTGIATKSGFPDGSTQEYQIFAQDFAYFADFVDINGSDIDVTVQLMQDFDQAYTLTCGDVTIQNGVITACSYTFSKTDIIIPDTLCGQTIISIGEYTFNGKGITSVIFPKYLETIGQSAFTNNNMQSVDLESYSNLKSIGNYAFMDNSIASLWLPKSLTFLGNAAFTNNSITSLNEEAFDGYFYALNNDGSQNLSILVSYGGESDHIVIPVGVQVIAGSCFFNCGLLTADFGSAIDLIRIEDHAFSSNNMSTINLTQCVSLKKIEWYAFANNPLYSANLSSCISLISIEDGVFKNCPMSGFILPTPQLEEYVFRNWKDQNGNEFAGGETVSDLNLAYTANFADEANYLPLNIEVEVTDATCSNSSDGQLVITISGGLGGSYDGNGQTEEALFDGNSYDVNVYYSNGDLVNVPTMSDSSNVCFIDYGLKAGIYTVEVIDTRGSFVSTTVMISSPVPLDFNLIKESDVTCTGNIDGSFSIMASGGTSPYQYGVSEFEGVAPSGFVMDSMFIVPAGVYFAWVKDANGCVAGGNLDLQHRIIIEEPSPVDFTVEMFDVCYGAEYANAKLSVTSLKSAASFKVVFARYEDGIQVKVDTSDYFSNELVITGLLFDNNAQADISYQFSIIDVNGCSSDSKTVIFEPVIIPLTISALELEKTDGKTNFEIWAEGGTSPYTMLLNGAVIDANADKILFTLAAGTHVIEVVDAMNCSVYDTLVIEGAKTEDVEFVITDGLIPVSGAVVTLDEFGTITSNNEGRVIFNNIVDGTYSFSINAENYIVYTGSLTVSGSRVTKEITLEEIVSETYFVKFIVTDGKNPIAEATVTLGDSTAITNENGVVVFASVSDGNYDYSVNAEDYENYASSLTVNGNDVTKELTLQQVIDEAFFVKFIITSEGYPVSGAIIELDSSLLLTTGSNGQAIFSNVPDGTYGYSVIADGYIEIYGEVIVSGGNFEQPVNLSTELFFVEFMVSNGTNPILGAIVELFGYETAETNINGIASFKVPANEPDLFYSIKANGYTTLWDTVTVMGSNVSEQVVLSSAHTVMFFVVNENDDPVAGAMIELEGYGMVISDDSGQCIFEGVVDSELLGYNAWAIGFDSESDTLSVNGKDVLKEIVIRQSQSEPFSVTFSVVDSTGPIQGAMVSVSGYGTLETNSNGEVVFNNVYADSLLTYSASANGYDLFIGYINLVNENLSVLVNVTPIRIQKYKVSFIVLDEGNPVEGAFVSFGKYGSLTSNADGKVTFDNVSPSDKIAYSVFANDYYLENGTVKVEEANAIFELAMQSIVHEVKFIVLSNGSPVEGAYVLLGDYGTKVTDNQGVVTFENVYDEAQIEYCVYSAGNDLKIGSVSVLNANINKTIYLAPLNKNALISDYEVTFSVVNNDIPVVNATVFFGTYGFDNTGQDGKISFSNVKPNEKVAYCVRIDGYGLVLGETMVSNTEGNVVIDIYEAKYSAAFTVTENGLPLEGVSVNLQKHGIQKTNSEGIARFTGIDANSNLSFSISSENYNLEYGNILITDTDVSETIQLRSENNMNVRFVVKYGESVITGAIVSLSGYGSQITDENGRVVFNNVESTSGITYSVMAQNYQLLNGSLNVDKSDVEKQIDLSSSTYQASFIVQSENGLLEGAKVLLKGFGEQTTDSNGKVFFKNIPSGTILNYMVNAPAHENLAGKIMVGAANINQLLELEFVGYSIQFNVVDSDGNPVVGAEILFNEEKLLTDANGKVVFGGVNVNTSIDYTVLLDGYTTQNGSLNVTGDGVVETITLITTGMNDLLTPEIKVYPNPAQHFVTVENAEDNTIEIYNMSGQLLKQLNNAQSIERMDVRIFKAGVYILKVNDYTTKLIIR